MAQDGRRWLDEGAPMTPASLRQIRTLLGLWDTGRYDVGALDHASGRMSLREGWNLGQVLHARGWIAARNASGSSIYARPARSLDRHPWVLVDALDTGACRRIGRGHPPAALVETSPGRWQVWVRLEAALGAGGRVAAGRRLAREYGGGPGAVDGHPFGRLPGTTNRTPGLELANGQAPFAKLAGVHPQRSIRLAGVEVRDTPATEPAAQTTGGSVGCGRVRRDQCAIDFAIACRLAEDGRTDAEIAAVLRSARRDAKGDRPEYIARTIAAARRRVQHHPPGAPSAPPKPHP